MPDRWILAAISLSMMSLYKPDTDLNLWGTLNKKQVAGAVQNSFDGYSYLLYGIRPYTNAILLDMQKDYMEKYLTANHNIVDRDTLISKIEQYFTGSPIRIIFNNIRKKITAVSESECKTLLNSLPSESAEYSAYETVIKYDYELPAAGILAFDLANIANLCRLGAYLLFLSQTEMEGYLKKALNLAFTHYESFNDFGIAAAVGMQMYKKGKGYKEILEMLKSCLYDKNSMWQYVKWGSYTV